MKLNITIIPNNNLQLDFKKIIGLFNTNNRKINECILIESTTTYIFNTLIFQLNNLSMKSKYSEDNFLDSNIHMYKIIYDFFIMFIDSTNKNIYIINHDNWRHFLEKSCELYKTNSIIEYIINNYKIHIYIQSDELTNLIDIFLKINPNGQISLCSQKYKYNKLYDEYVVNYPNFIYDKSKIQLSLLSILTNEKCSFLTNIFWLNFPHLISD